MRSSYVVEVLSVDTVPLSKIRKVHHQERVQSDLGEEIHNSKLVEPRNVDHANLMGVENLASKDGYLVGLPSSCS
jgi:hypothetical protein